MIKPPPDWVGKSFGRLTVISFAEKRRSVCYWNCKCSCGNLRTVRSYALERGETISCGCYASERRKATRARLDHGYSPLKNNVRPEYRAYHSAKARCENPKNISYPRYGGKGIKFCFSSFDEFIAEIGNKPTPQHSLDRIDPQGNYKPGNVRWATDSLQSRNRKDRERYTIGNETLLLTEWSERSGVDLKLIFERLSRHWCIRCSVFNSSGQTCSHKTKA